MSTIDPYMPSLVWLIVVGFIIAFVLAFGIGANDVANSFGTSVGSKVLTIYQACILATIFEIAGAILIGYKVSDTMRKGILDITLYREHELDLMLGSVSALSASAIWLLVATFLKMPISGTHSIVGATIGFSLAVHGLKGIRWKPIFMIVASWFISPALSGLISSVIFIIIQYGILKRRKPLKCGFISLPFFYGFTSIVNMFSVMHDGPKLLHMDNIPLWLAATISIGCGLLIMLIVQIFIVPWQRRKITKSLHDPTQVNFSIGGSAETSPNPSLTRKNNRLSQLSNEDKHLTVITESAEMLPLTPQVVVPNINYTSESHTIANNAKSDISNGNKEHMSSDKSTVSKDNKSSLHVIESTVTINPMMTPNTSTMRLINDKRSTMLSNESTSQFEIDQSPNHNNTLTKEIVEVKKLFSFLQVLTAIFGSFAHGGNDVSNAIGPLVALWLIYTEGSVEQKAETPILILLYGGVGISIGLWVWGRRVIKTVGEDLTTITAETGFSIELGSAFTVLLASKIGIPISTTHCKVGSVVFVGLVNYVTTSAKTKGVDWKLFRHIISAWLITVPIAAILSAGCMAALRAIVHSSS